MLVPALLMNLALVAAGQPPPTAEELLARLDLTSFPNSTGPLHLPAPGTPAAAGFDEAWSEAGGWAYRSREGGEPGDGGGWRIGLRILEVNADSTAVCFRDVAHTGGSYSVQTALILTPTGDGYSARKGPARADCPEWRRRSEAAPSG